MAEELEAEEGRKNVFRIAKQMVKYRQDVVRVTCLKDKRGNLVLDEEGRKKIWKEFVEKLLSEENEWDQDVVCEKKGRNVG